jgi:branched-chain amino acid transport system permease protein
MPRGRRSKGVLVHEKRSLPQFLALSNRVATTAGLVGLVIVALYPVYSNDTTRLNQFIPIGIFSLVALGLNFTIGSAGEFALGLVGSFAAGAYTEGILTTSYQWSFWNAVGFAMVIACGVGLLSGLPGLRLGGWYFALTSLFVGLVVPDIASELNVAGKQDGFGNIPPASIFGHVLTNRQTYMLVLVSLLVALVVFRNLFASLWGLAFNCMRESNRGAEAAGINVRRMKLLAYLIASVVAGFAGAIYAAFAGYISPAAFPFSLTIELVAGPVIGGLGLLTSPLVGVGLLQILPNSFSNFSKYALLIYGVILIVVMIFLRAGLLNAARNAWNWVAIRLGRRLGWLDEGAAGQREGIALVGANIENRVALDRIEQGPDRASLTVDGVWKRFGGLAALADVSMSADPGRIAAVIGPNGSGKTTLLNVISGFYRVDRGTVLLGTEVISGKKTYAIARAGVARTFQTPHLIPDRTARENVMTGMFHRRRASIAEVMVSAPRARREQWDSRATSDALLDFVGLLPLAEVEAGSLTAGQQRLLEICRALASGPRVLLLDEPAAGLVGAEVAALARILSTIRETNCAVILIEHNVGLVMELADEITVLDAGAVIATGTPAAIQKNPAVLAAYLGEPTVRV